MRKGRLIELFKDMLIVLLALSAVYLALRGRTVEETAAPDRTEHSPVELRPLRMAVNFPGVGTYGVQYDMAAVDKLYEKLFGVLGEALAAAGAPSQAPEPEWRAALTEQSSVYFDFQGEVPLSLLYAWTEAGPDGALAGVSARRLLLAEDGTGELMVYYNNNANPGLYYACRTGSALRGHLAAAAAPYAANVNGATFAFRHRREEGYEKLDPYVMLPKGGQVIRKPVYRAVNPVGRGQGDQARKGLMTALGFHPQANTSYVAGGKQVVKEGADTLILYDTGAVDYHSSSAEEPRYPVGDLDLVTATLPLAEQSVGAFLGDARTAGVYLIGVKTLPDGGWQVDYGCQLGGVPVRLGGEGYAARFLIKEGRVSDFYLFLRSYTATEEQMSLLPELQAAAAMGALDAGGKELLLVYEDSGSSETVKPGWIAE